MMNRKRMAAAMAVVWAMTGIFAGCGNAANSGIEEDNAAGATEDTTEIGETDLYVFIAASLSNAMEEVADMFSKDQPNVNIIYNADSSGTLQTQIEEGAECDIFFSAATKQMTALKDGGYVVDGSVVDLLENQVVLIKGTGVETAVTGFDNVTSAASMALGNEDTPAGQYAREIFTSLGNLEDVLTMEINECANVTAVLSAVSEQSNEVGVVYATDAASMSDSVEIVAAAPEGSMEPAIYPVGEISNVEATADEEMAAETFLSYLQSKEVLSVFEKYGFTIH